MRKGLFVELRTFFSTRSGLDGCLVDGQLTASFSQVVSAYEVRMELT